MTAGGVSAGWLVLLLVVGWCSCWCHGQGTRWVNKAVHFTPLSPEMIAVAIGAAHSSGDGKPRACAGVLWRVEGEKRPDPFITDPLSG